MRVTSRPHSRIIEPGASPGGVTRRIELGHSTAIVAILVADDRSIADDMIITYPKIDRDSIHKLVRAKYDCAHHSTIVRKKTVKGGAQMIRAQCTRCGEMVGTALKKDSFTPAQLDSMPAWKDDLKIGYWKAFSDEVANADATAQRASLEAFRSQYEAYLETPAWKKKSELVLTRAQGICEGCRSAKATQVHHLTYDHCGEEFLFELVAMCRPCHERIHGAQIPQPNSSVPPSYKSRGDKGDDGEGDDDCPF